MFPRFSPEFDPAFPRLSPAEALAYIGGRAPDPRDGPGDYEAVSMFTRPQGVELHRAKGQGFLNYLKDFNRVKRETEEGRRWTNASQSADEQMRLIQNASEFMAQKNLERDLASGVDPALAFGRNFRGLGSGAQTALVREQVGAPTPPRWLPGDTETGEPPHWATDRTVIQPYQQRTSSSLRTMTDQEQFALTARQKELASVNDELEIYGRAREGSPAYQRRLDLENRKAQLNQELAPYLQLGETTTDPSTSPVPTAMSGRDAIMSVFQDWVNRKNTGNNE